MDQSNLPSAAARSLDVLSAFFRSSVAGGLVLMASACVALAWSNSSAAPSYQALLALPIGVSAGAASFAMPLHDWVNEGLMALFFLLVGLEIRREITQGQLASVRLAAGPLVGALGGMVAPALIYVAVNHANPAALRGWAVPVATDIAFALAALSLLGARVPVALKVFLTALAILDDFGAIVVIALFYSRGLDWAALGVAAAILAGLFGLRLAGVRALGPYLLGGAVLWAAIYRSGIHTTLSGVALAFVVPMGGEPGEGACPAERLERALDGWDAYAILPLFGLANAGLAFDALPPGALWDRLALGTALGLFVGKQIGVFGATMLAARLRLVHLPPELTAPVLYGGSVLCGIGFTMSLFIGDLAFPGPGREAEVKLAIFGGSLLSALLGLLVLRRAARQA